jgi:hypothetical protein
MPAGAPTGACLVGGDDARGVLALARVQHDEPRLVEFAAIDGSLQSLLAEFGPGGPAKSRHYPFWHLATDGQGCGPRGGFQTWPVGASGSAAIESAGD